MSRLAAAAGGSSRLTDSSTGRLPASAREGSSAGLGVPPAVGCLISVLLGLIGVLIFFFVVSMALRGEVRIARGELGDTRAWWVDEGEDRGLGLSSTRIVSGDESSGDVCLETRVRFVMLKSTEERRPIRYCECFEKIGGAWQSAGGCDG